MPKVKVSVRCPQCEKPNLCEFPRMPKPDSDIHLICQWCAKNSVVLGAKAKLVQKE